MVTKSEKGDMYTIKTFCGKAIDCYHQHNSNGTKIIQWKETGDKNQRWAIEPA